MMLRLCQVKHQMGVSEGRCPTNIWHGKSSRLVYGYGAQQIANSILVLQQHYLHASVVQPKFRIQCSQMFPRFLYQEVIAIIPLSCSSTCGSPFPVSQKLVSNQGREIRHMRLRKEATVCATKWYEYKKFGRVLTPLQLFRFLCLNCLFVEHGLTWCRHRNGQPFAFVAILIVEDGAWFAYHDHQSLLQSVGDASLASSRPASSCRCWADLLYRSVEAWFNNLLSTCRVPPLAKRTTTTQAQASPWRGASEGQTHTNVYTAQGRLSSQKACNKNHWWIQCILTIT